MCIALFSNNTVEFSESGNERTLPLYFITEYVCVPTAHGDIELVKIIQTEQQQKTRQKIK